MTKANASKITYECEKCGTKYEITIPYHFPDGTKFSWQLTDAMHPNCIMQYAPESGFPADHVVQWKKTERVRIESGESK